LVIDVACLKEDVTCLSGDVACSTTAVFISRFIGDVARVVV
jgi:hypothetical protein